MASPAAARRQNQSTQAMARHRLDLDPSRLTTFPMPGFMESSNFQKEPPRSERPSSHMEPAARNVPAPPHSTGNQQYWMPDHLCKACYDCEVPFSFFRRRHHCRLCGMIFCFECSDQFIDGAAHGHSGQIRVCKFCARFVDDLERKMSIMNAPQRRDSLGRSTNANVHHNRDSNDANGTAGGGHNGAHGAAGGSGNAGAGGTNIRDSDTVSPLLFVPHTTRSGDNPTLYDTTSTLTSLDSFFSVGSAANLSFLDSPPSPNAVDVDNDNATLPPLFTIVSSPTAAALTPSASTTLPTDPSDGAAGTNDSDALAHPRAQRSFQPRPPHNRRRRSSAELLGAIESGGLLESELQQLQAMKIGKSNAKQTRSTETHAVDATDAAPLSYQLMSDQQTQREIGLDAYMHGAHAKIRAGIARAVQTALPLLTPAATTTSATATASTAPLDATHLATSLEDIAFVVAGHLLFSMRFRASNGFNYKQLVKVKSIALAETVHKSPSTTLPSPNSKFQFKWLAGTLCRKHLSHKLMARQLANPRILLFACGISYDRSAGAGRLNSLDTLLEQERSYMSILVDKITALEPDVIFVERTVSRHAQELLRARRVGIVLNVKFEILERLSRHTGAALLTSVDHVDKSRAATVVGTCRSFLVKTVPIVPDDEEESESATSDAAIASAAADAAGASLTVLTKPATNVLGRVLPALGGAVGGGGSRAKTETYLYVDGCDPLNGCTILLTGQSKMQLRVLKRVTRRVVAMTYRLLLEAHVLSDLHLIGTALTRRRPGGDTTATTDSSVDDTTKDVNDDDVDKMTWYTTCTLRVREHSSVNIRYHPCTGCKFFGIRTYADEDISFGNFLTQEMAALLLKCQSPKCSYSMADHVQTFSCQTGTITVSFEELPLESRLPISRSLDQSSSDASAGAHGESLLSRPALLTKLLGREINVLAMLNGIYDPQQQSLDPTSNDAAAAMRDAGAASKDDAPDATIVFWRWCRACSAMVAPFVPLDKYIYKYSFARLLEVLFLDAAAASTSLTTSQSPQQDGDPTAACRHTDVAAHVLFFNVGDWVARFDFAAKAPLQLAPAALHSDARREKLPNDSVIDRNNDSIHESIVALAVGKRLVNMQQLLATLIALFTEKVRGIKHAVEAFERADDSLQAQIVLEVVCLTKLIQSDQLVFAHRIERLEADAAHALAECDVAQRALYLLACRWLDRMLKLRKLIKKSLSTEATAAMASSSFTLAGFSFSTPTALSPIPSPRSSSVSRDESEYSSLAPSTIARDASDFHWDAATTLTDRFKRTSSDNGSDLSPESSIASMSTSSAATTAALSSTSSFASLESSMSASKKLERLNGKNSSDKDMSQSSWRTALWDLYRVLGRNAPGSDFQVDLPDALLAGHPSLPYRSGDNVVLVNTTEPITCVAYALSSDLYDEQLDAWKLHVHNEAAATIAPTINHHVAAATSSGVQTNWSRAALETALNTPFKYSISERPLHASLLAGDLSGQCTSPWEFSTIAYYPLQFEVLRELFYGSLDAFLFSIAHVQSWDANGGKSGASFYRTLDDRFVVKHITSTELQSFLEVLPSYFKYMSSVYFDGRASIISKTVGLYQTMITRRETGQRTIQYISVMENVFCHKRIARTYDLKGSSRNRYIKPSSDPKKARHRVLLDGNLLESSCGHPIGVVAESHARIVAAVKNDSTFLNSINMVDYSMVIGMTEDSSSTDAKSSKNSVATTEITVGIIDYYRQFDLLKRVESVSKSVGMIAGQSSPTIIEPALYGKRFDDAINRYFMPVSAVSSSASTVATVATTATTSTES